MKNSVFISISVLASLLLLGACNKDNVSVGVPESRVVKVSAALEPATKVSTGSAIGKFTWESGDVIGVWTGTKFTPFTLEESAAGAAAGIFTGTLDEGESVGEASVAVYPYSESDTYVDGKYVSAYSPSNWDYKLRVPLAAKATAVTSGSTTVASFKFAHLGALAGLTLKNIPAEAKFVFLESNKQLFFLDGTADMTVDYPKFSSDISTCDYAFVALPEHSAAIESLTLYVPIVTGELTDPKFRFTLFTDTDWGAEMDKATYNHYGFLNTKGYINRGDLFVLPDVTF